MKISCIFLNLMCFVLKNFCIPLKKSSDIMEIFLTKVALMASMCKSFKIINCEKHVKKNA